MIELRRFALVAAIPLVVMATTTVSAKGASQGQNNGQPFQAIQSLIDENRALIDSNKAEIDELRTQATEIIAAVAELDDRVGDTEARMGTVELDVANLTAEVDQVSGSLTSLYQRVSSLARQHAVDIRDIRREIAFLNRDVAANRQQLRALSAQLAAKTQQLSAAINDNAIAIDGLTSNLAVLNAEVSMLAISLGDAEDDIESLEGRADNHETEIAALMMRVSTVEADIASYHPDPVDLTDVELSYESEGRDVHIFKTPRAAVLANFVDYCEARGLEWWSPKSSADGQLLLDNARAIDNFHTWIQVYGLVTTTGNPATINGFSIAPDSPQCVAGSSEGWAAVRDWGCSLCDPESMSGANNGLSHCWDSNHQYDWFACEAP